MKNLNLCELNYLLVQGKIFPNEIEVNFISYIISIRWTYFYWFFLQISIESISINIHVHKSYFRKHILFKSLIIKT